MPSKQYIRTLTNSSDNGGALLLLNSPQTAPLPPKPPPSNGFKVGGVTRRTIRRGMRDRLRTE